VSFLRETDFEEIRVENAFGDLYEESDEESESGDQLGVGLKSDILNDLMINIF